MTVQGPSVVEMAHGMTELDLYVWTVTNLGVPARTYHENGRIVMEAPFTRLEPDALARVLQHAKDVVA